MAENRRDRNSEMTGCPWYVNLAFFKSENSIYINNIIDNYKSTHYQSPDKYMLHEFISKKNWCNIIVKTSIILKVYNNDIYVTF